jgi:TatD DNase family protein
VIDFHCHVDLYPNALELLPLINDRNRFTFAVTTSPRAYLATSKVLAPYSRIRIGVGLHPEVAMVKAQELDLLLDLIGSVKLVGEIGIDGSSRFKPSLPLQEKIFRAALTRCRDVGGRVMSIHSRGAERLVIDCIEQTPGAGTPVLHWFSGSQQNLRAAIDLGCWFSVGPAMLRGAKGRQLAAMMPRDRVLPETDGPFTEVNGTILNPWQAWDVCSVLADLWQQSATDVESLMIENLGRMPGFRKV